MTVDTASLPGVAQAYLKALAPKAKATTNPTNISFRFLALMIFSLSSVFAWKDPSLPDSDKCRGSVEHRKGNYY